MSGACESGAVVFNAITYKTHGCEILHGLNGAFPHGKFTGVLGPSGSGKTTLLNILTGFYTQHDGDISHTTAMKNSSRYIMQETIMDGLLTVRETMQIAYELKCDASESVASIKCIDGLLGKLKLDGIKHTRTACISNGERKRLSIAVELLSEPSTLFLDEPTTGLDVISSNIVLNYLKQLSSNGTTIICTIHQPSAVQFALFDHVYVLAQNGNCIYQGTPGMLLASVERFALVCPIYHNPADFIIEIASGQYGDEALTSLEDAYRYPNNTELVANFDLNEQQCDKKQSSTYENNSSNSISSSSELCVLLKREFIKAKRNPTLTYLRLITGVTNSLALCAIFWRVGSDASKIWFNFNAILGFVLHLIAPSLMLTILTFPLELNVLRREHFNKWYRLHNFYFAITLIDLPISIIYCVVSNGIVYYLTDQPLEWKRFLMFLTLGFFICIIAQSFGLLFGAIFNVVNGTFIGSALTFVLMMFAGFGITLKDLPRVFQFLSYTSYLRYGVEGMAGAVNGYNRTRLECPDTAVYCRYTNARRFLDDIGVDGESFSFYVCILTNMFLTLRILTYVILKYKLNVR